MCFLYPCRNRWSPARADTFLIMGCACGLTLGISLKYALGMQSYGKIRNDATLNISRSSASYNLLILKRSLIGIINVLLGRILSKQTVYLLIRLKYGLNKKSKNIDVKDIIKNNFNLEIFYYLFCYIVISFSAIFNSFVIFQLV